MAAEAALVKEGIDIADKVLDLYNKIADNAISWKVYEDTLTNLDKYKDDYSKESGKLVGEVKTLIMNAKDSYHESVQTVFEWCSLTSKLLPVYNSLLKNPTDADIQSQKNIILKILDDGSTKMRNAQNVLAKCSVSFNDAAGRLVALRAQLHSDFDTQSTYYQVQVDKLHKQSAITGGIGLITGVFGLIIAIKNIVDIETKMIPEMRKKFGQIEEYYKNLNGTIDKAGKDIDDTKDKLKEEIEVIGKLKVQTEETRFYVADDNLRPLVEESANNLIARCNEYMKRHGVSTATF